MANIYKGTLGLIGNTPLIEAINLEKAYNLEAKLLFKLEYFNPAGSVKDRIAKAMIEDAEAKGQLKEGSVIIEPTSGNTGIGLAALAAAGAGAAMLMKKTREINEEENLHVKETTANYRNTERGKHDKNSKGIYYSNGNYEAFARPEKPEGVDDKHAYIVGSGLASLAAACFLVRDAQMPGDHIHILEAMDIAGGACDGSFDPSRGYFMRGGREMENHFECLWDLFRSIPSLD